MKTRAKVPLIVHTIVLDEHDRILLLERCGTGFMDGFYSFPGGHVQDQEDIVDAAIREVREEAGIVLEEIQPAVVMPFESGVDFIFVSSKWSGEARICEPDKCSDLRWFNEQELPTNIVPFAIEVFRCVAEGVWFHEFKG